MQGPPVVLAIHTLGLKMFGMGGLKALYIGKLSLPADVIQFS